MLYYEGAKAVQAGGHELSMLASHLCFMLRGTSEHRGPLWQHRVLPDGLAKEIVLDRFSDYLLKPARVGLGLPSLHFLRQVLKATPQRGEEALALVKEQLGRELIDLDAAADTERDRERLKREVRKTGRPEKGNPGLPLSKGDNARRAAQLAKRRPDLAARVRGGTMRLSAALVEAGIRKRLTPLDELRRAWKRASAEERAAFLAAPYDGCETARGGLK